MSCRRRGASNASLATPRAKTEGLAAVGSIWLVGLFVCGV
jgi:hypothetical protein